MTATAPARLRRVPRAAVLLAAIVVAVEALAVALYLAVANVTITDPLILVYPFVWINVGLLAVVATEPPTASRRDTRLAAAVGVAYFVVLAAVGGLVAPGAAFRPGDVATGLGVAWTLPPGWGPMVLYGGTAVNVAVIPFKVAGYAALAYLVAVTVLDAAGSAVAGLLGLLSCVSCTWPVLGTLLTSVLGGASAVTAFATGQPYGASTLVYVSAVALLWWRPLRRRR